MIVINVPVDVDHLQVEDVVTIFLIIMILNQNMQPLWKMSGHINEREHVFIFFLATTNDSLKYLINLKVLYNV